VHGWCTGAGAAPSDESIRTTAEAEAVPWDKRVAPIAATAALALYGNQVRRTKNKRVLQRQNRMGYTGGEGADIVLQDPNSLNIVVQPIDTYLAIEDAGLNQDADLYDTLAKKEAARRVHAAQVERASTGYKPRDFLLGL
jgi:hypothetical protein